MLVCLQRCCTNDKAIPDNYFPVFSENACQQWRCLHEWSGAKISHYLPAIRDNKGVEIKILAHSKYVKFMYSNITGITPNVGNWVSPNCATTSDPTELDMLIKTTESGAYLIELVSFVQQISLSH